jgi:uncharacterized coiled-coil protein SlyX
MSRNTLGRTVMFLQLWCLCAISSAQEPASPQTPSTETTEQRIQQLTDAVTKAQAQVEASQRQILQLQQELVALQEQVAKQKALPPQPAETTTAADAVVTLTKDVEDLHERQAMQESQIATLDQSKVESESKYPLKITGLILANGFVNTHKVDIASDPTYALSGSGTTGLSLRQTMLGLDARGPHLFGATTGADVRVDFFGVSTQSSYNAGGLLRLRTAHARINWKNTEVFVELDRTILAPNSPSSLTATAEPALAWAGNLWSWNPQFGISRQIDLGGTKHIKTQVALIDAQDPPVLVAASSTSILSASLAEQSRWPGTEARVAFASGADGVGPEIGFGGYFSPHRTPGGTRFSAWAGTMDLRLPLPKHFELTGSFYRGQALGGLGGDGFKDYVYRTDIDMVQPLSDVGGWAQIKKRLGERLELNAAYGMDNVFASELRPYALSSGMTSYSSIARNKTFFTNFIFSPTASMLFSVEYRHLLTAPIIGPIWVSDVVGAAAGYRF